MTTKEALYRLIDDLPDKELPEAERLLLGLTIEDPVERSLALAPIDDEPLSDEELAASEAGPRRGRPRRAGPGRPTRLQGRWRSRDRLLVY